TCASRRMKLSGFVLCAATLRVVLQLFLFWFLPPSAPPRRNQLNKKTYTNAIARHSRSETSAKPSKKRSNLRGWQGSIRQPNRATTRKSWSFSAKHRWRSGTMMMHNKTSKKHWEFSSTYQALSKRCRGLQAYLAKPIGGQVVIEKRVRCFEVLLRCGKPQRGATSLKFHWGSTRWAGLPSVPVRIMPQR